MIKLVIIIFLSVIFTGYCSAGEIVDDTLQSINVGDIAGISDGLRRGLDVNFADPDGNSLLMQAVRSGNLESVALLVNAGARVYPSNGFGDTALLLASFAGHERIADILLAKGASLDANPQGWTPLHYAAFAGHIRLVNKFLDQGGKVNATTQSGLTPLMVAAMNGHLAVVQSLLGHGADPTLRDGNDVTALEHALARGNTTIAEVLGQSKKK